MITDGVDYYDMPNDPDDPYGATAVDDAVRARLMVYAIYWQSGDRSTAQTTGPAPPEPACANH